MAYNFEISYVRTEEFGHADILSRITADRPQEDFAVAAITEKEALDQRVVSFCNENAPVDFNQIRIATDADDDLRLLMK